MRISDWSSDVCSSDLMAHPAGWTRVFIDEGEVIASLINEICAGGPSMDSAAHAFVSRLASLMRHGLVMETEDDGEYGLGSRLARREIGRASCRERVCQYV